MCLALQCCLEIFFRFYEGWKVTLLESMNKRCTFLEHVVAVSGLSNVQVLRERAEVCSFLFCILNLLNYFSLCFNFLLRCHCALLG